MTKQVLRTSALFLALIALAGCASSAQGIKTSTIAESVPTETLKSDVPAGSVLAVIRYPAVVEPNARDIYHRAYARRAIGGVTGRGVTNTIETVAIADSTVVKSNYFALSLYKELAEKLPEHTVLLSPHAIKLGSGGELTSEPITSAEDIPSVVSIDFATYSFPDSRRMLEDVPLTFGDLVTPLITVRTSHRAAASTQGVLMASRPLVSRAVAESQEVATETIRAMQRGDLEPVIPELDFVSFITNDTPKRIPIQELAVKSNRNAAISLPVEKIRIPPSELARLYAASDGTVDPIDNIYTDALSHRIVALINSVDANKAVMMGKAASVAKFDPNLAALTFVGSTAEDFTARLAYAERLLDAQRRYLSVQSLRIFDGIHNGELGSQVRDMIAEEHKVLEKRRALGNIRSNRAGPNDFNRFSNGVFSSSIRQLGGAASSVYSSRARLSQQIGNNYLNAIVPALAQQTSVTIDLLESNETITAIRYEDLQSRLEGIYSDNQRALDTVATQCGYIGMDGTKQGTWLGVCENGLANGPGAGVLRTDTDVMEYYGYARDGLADGLGLMIRHSTLGSLSFEGSFKRGLPDGVVRVSQAGRPDEIRTYERGINKGVTTEEVPTPFVNVTAAYGN